MRKARTIAAVLGAAAVVTLTGCSDDPVQRSDDAAQAGYIEGTGAVTVIEPAEREPAPEFGGPLLGRDGEFELADARGELVVLNVWASWCPPCRKEAPALQAVQEDFAADGVRFVGVNTRDNDEVAALAFEEEFGITYPSVVDPDGRRMLAFRDTLPPNAIPTTLVIDRDGEMAARVLGAITEDSLRGMLTDLLAEDHA